MKLQVLVDGVDKGTVDLAGGDLRQYGDVIGAFNQLVCDIYKSENEGGPDDLVIASDVRLKRRARRPPR